MIFIDIFIYITINVLKFHTPRFPVKWYRRTVLVLIRLHLKDFTLVAIPLSILRNNCTKNKIWVKNVQNKLFEILGHLLDSVKGLLQCKLLLIAVEFDEDLTGVVIEEDQAELELHSALTKARKVKQKQERKNPEKVCFVMHIDHWDFPNHHQKTPILFWPP